MGDFAGQPAHPPVETCLSGDRESQIPPLKALSRVLAWRHAHCLSANCMNRAKPNHYEDLLRSSNDTTSPAVNVESPQPESPVVTELLAAFSNPDLDLDHIVELIACEPRLSTEILRRSNSVRFGGKAPATDIFAAISRIGISEAQNALVALRA